MSGYSHYLQITYENIRYEAKFPLYPVNRVEEYANNILLSWGVCKERFDEVRDFLFANYLKQVWLAESPATSEVDVTEIVDSLVEGKGDVSLDNFNLKKLRNLLSAINFVFNRENTLIFDINLSHTIHQMIGEGLFLSPGTFREKPAAARHSFVHYASPEVIITQLSELFIFVSASKKKVLDEAHTDVEKVLDLIRLGTLFFSEFLLIHPYNNGNGRTARLLLSVFVAEVIQIPFTPFIRNRQEYISTLEKRNNRSPPNDLALYILQSCNHVSAQTKWVLATTSND